MIVCENVSASPSVTHISFQEGMRQKAEGNQQLMPQTLVKKAPPRVYAQTIIRIRMPGHFIVQVGTN